MDEKKGLDADGLAALRRLAEEATPWQLRWALTEGRKRRRMFVAIDIEHRKAVLAALLELETSGERGGPAIRRLLDHIETALPEKSQRLEATQAAITKQVGLTPTQGEPRLPLARKAARPLLPLRDQRTAQLADLGGLRRIRLAPPRAARAGRNGPPERTGLRARKAAHRRTTSSPAASPPAQTPANSTQTPSASATIPGSEISTHDNAAPHPLHADTQPSHHSRASHPRRITFGSQRPRRTDAGCLQRHAEKHEGRARRQRTTARGSHRAPKAPTPTMERRTQSLAHPHERHPRDGSRTQ